MVKDCKTEGGFAVYQDVNNPASPLGDETPSYFSGKTLKYFFLLFGGSSHVDFHKTIFTVGGQQHKISLVHRFFSSSPIRLHNGSYDYCCPGYALVHFSE